MLEFYRPLDEENFWIQQEAVRFALAKDLVHNPKAVGYAAVAPAELMANVPSLVPLLEKYKIDPKFAGFLISDNNSTSPIHIEWAHPRSRLEIPVIGCQYSYTAFYSAAVVNRSRDQLGNEYWLCREEGAVELDRFTLTRPTIVRVDVPFRVKVTRVHVKRISLAITPKNTLQLD